MKRRPVWHTLAALSACLMVGSHAGAKPPPKRDVPNYDGRGPEKRPGEAALWVPRILVSPLYLTSEYVLRRPLGTLISDAERAHVPKTLYDFFTFGPEHQAGFAPIAFWDFGFNPAFGIYFFWDDALVKRNDLRLHGTTFGKDWLAGSVVDRIRFGKNDDFALHLIGVRRPEYAFFGTGPRSLESHLSRYGQDLIDAGWVADFHPWRSSRIVTGMGIRNVNAHHGHYYHDPSIERRASTGVFPVPFGFDREYTAEYQRVFGSLDTREPRPAPGTGVRVQAEGEQASDFSNSPVSNWVRYGFSAGGYLDLDGHQRVLGLTAATQFVDPLGSHPIPFEELVSLGPVSFSEQALYSNYQLMPGFRPGRLRGRSGAVLIAHYTWPIWVWLDGTLQAAVGNVFDGHLDNFKPSLLRFSGAVGFAAGQFPDGSIECLVGLGTETFAHGAQVDAVRFTVGMNRVF